jgi:hypothetical protein
VLNVRVHSRNKVCSNGTWTPSIRPTTPPRAHSCANTAIARLSLSRCWSVSTPVTPCSYPHICNSWHLQRHTQRRHEIDLCCARCGDAVAYTFASCTQYLSHMKYHRGGMLQVDIAHIPGTSPHLCSECGAAFRRPVDLQRHTNAVHKSTGIYECSLCALVVAQPVQVRQQLRPNPCPVGE